ncbi:uncharacterized protein BP01DRAFT_225774 [Aspergillus saccharolyticus JOP 1030-1]|uniref:Uncharacterized protein n=1 Tax=Aspergillus saccharolyticus JOP 1030-1 TaxID=1450539 RepID=A0A318Z601_9EURO|nr:hypothetical protein BP01DRAFT_225774 [Aspergillus saccharolyticus JOP 1030-1]PYH40183.1 hypothetical protein BP01DRAFT_225774 [Aspergillus saccharolyticus JOP 1030-1]
MLAFTAMLNIYLTDAYKESLCICTVSGYLYKSDPGCRFTHLQQLQCTLTKLEVHWAGSLVGFLALALAFILFAFIKYGKLAV